MSGDCNGDDSKEVHAGKLAPNGRRVIPALQTRLTPLRTMVRVAHHGDRTSVRAARDLHVSLLPIRAARACVTVPIAVSVAIAVSVVIMIAVADVSIAYRSLARFLDFVRANCLLALDLELALTLDLKLALATDLLLIDAIVVIRVVHTVVPVVVPPVVPRPIAVDDPCVRRQPARGDVAASRGGLATRRHA